MTAESQHAEDAALLKPRVDLGAAGVRIAFPILLEGDLVTTPEHLGVAYLIAVLRDAGADCCVIEVRTASDLDNAVVRIMNYRPTIIGLTLTTVTASGAGLLGTRLREVLGDRVKIVAGGPLATFHAKHLFRMADWDFLDILVRGEGEIALLRLVEHIVAKKCLKGVKGIIFKQPDGQLFDTGLGPTITNLDALPYPARDQQQIHGWRLPYVRVSTSRGCTSRCTFCNAPHAGNNFHGVKLWRASSVARVLDELEHILHTTGHDTFDFVDSTFEDPGGTAHAKQRVRNIAQGLIERGLQVYFNCNVQARNWSEHDRELIDLLYCAGLEKILIGVEAGTDRELMMWSKRSTVADNSRAIRLFSEAGVYVAFGFIMFHPYADFETVQRNVAFLGTHMGHNLRRFTTRLELYPGTRILEQLRAEGMLAPDFDFTSNPLGYSYKDTVIGDMALAVNRLYGDRYAETGEIDEEPTAFTFETFDITVHTFFSRLRRQHADNAHVMDRIEHGEVALQRIKARMTVFNTDLISTYIDTAQRDTLHSRNYAKDRKEVDLFVRSCMEEIKAIQLRTGLSVRRMTMPSYNTSFRHA